MKNSWKNFCIGASILRMGENEIVFKVPSSYPSSLRKVPINVTGRGSDTMSLTMSNTTVEIAT